MESCASYVTSNDVIQYQATMSIFAISSTTENFDRILTTTHISKYNNIAGPKYTNNNNTDENRIEMDIEGSNLDLISNWKTVSNEEENEMAISVYIGIHVVIGLIGVFFNGW